MKKIATVYTDFPTKFGVPRQSGLCEELTGKIIFEPEYRVSDAFKGLDGFSHIWVIWQFSEAVRDSWSPTVRPPRLGGNKRVGVFATRSPFRPNNIGLSCVKLEKVEHKENNSPVLYVSGIDMMNGTPVYDIKPYIPLTDCRADATDGFTAYTKDYSLDVVFCDELLDILPESKRDAAIKMLALDPRPSYIEDESRIFGVGFAGYDIKFKVKDGILTVYEVVKL
ncbi:MAG: tRNA (N6-threonylcarbamoyladenosine(37)-N6)-methyltransferase TrmO [Clostridia bacterium]|nr:tRNA (N6-threonylcarbamoyladenosine(37)-N6)-methyltransferase TrmO [Clostridia bacterium]